MEDLKDLKKYKETLWDNLDRVEEIIKCLEPDNAKYEMFLKERDNIRNEIFKVGQLESEAKQEKIRNGIAIGTFIGTSFISIVGLIKTFKFDETSTPTSTLGRGILNNTILKLFK